MYQLISKHKTSVMGFAALLVTVNHFFASVVGLNLQAGEIAVDIFMFLTGLGLYCSLSKSEDSEQAVYRSLPGFYKRRFARIFPPYAVFLLIWAIWMAFYREMTVPAALINLLGAGYWLLPYELYFNWYISALLLCYAITPFVFMLMRSPEYRRSICSFLCVMLVFFLFLLRKDQDGSIHRMLIMLVRLIPFTLGMYCGARLKEPEKPITSGEKNLGITLFALGLALFVFNMTVVKDAGFTYGLPWLSYGLMTPFVCAVIAYLFEAAKGLKSIFDFMGKMSFEIYLTNIFVIEFVLADHLEKNIQLPSHFIVFLAAFAITLIFSYGLYIIMKICRRQLLREGLEKITDK